MEREVSTGGEPYVIVSSDTHAGLKCEEYRPYLDSALHAEFDDYVAERHEHRRVARQHPGRRRERSELVQHRLREGYPVHVDAVHGAVDDGVAARAQVLACVRGDDALSGGGDREPRGGSVRRSLPERLRRQLPGPIAG